MIAIAAGLLGGLEAAATSPGKKGGDGTGFAATFEQATAKDAGKSAPVGGKGGARADRSGPTVRRGSGSGTNTVGAKQVGGRGSRAVAVTDVAGELVGPGAETLTASAVEQVESGLAKSGQDGRTVESTSDDAAVNVHGTDAGKIRQDGASLVETEGETPSEAVKVPVASDEGTLVKAGTASVKASQTDTSPEVQAASSEVETATASVARRTVTRQRVDSWRVPVRPSPMRVLVENVDTAAEPATLPTPDVVAAGVSDVVAGDRAKVASSAKPVDVVAISTAQVAATQDTTADLAADVTAASPTPVATETVKTNSADTVPVANEPRVDSPVLAVSTAVPVVVVNVPVARVAVGRLEPAKHLTGELAAKSSPGATLADKQEGVAPTEGETPTSAWAYGDTRHVAPVASTDANPVTVVSTSSPIPEPLGSVENRDGDNTKIAVTHVASARVGADDAAISAKLPRTTAATKPPRSEVESGRATTTPGDFAERIASVASVPSAAAAPIIATVAPEASAPTPVAVTPFDGFPATPTVASSSPTASSDATLAKPIASHVPVDGAAVPAAADQVAPTVASDSVPIIRPLDGVRPASDATQTTAADQPLHTASLFVTDHEAHQTLAAHADIQKAVVAPVLDGDADAVESGRSAAGADSSGLSDAQVAGTSAVGTAESAAGPSNLPAKDAKGRSIAGASAVGSVRDRKAKSTESVPGTVAAAPRADAGQSLTLPAAAVASKPVAEEHRGQAGEESQTPIVPANAVATVESGVPAIQAHVVQGAAQHAASPVAGTSSEGNGVGVSGAGAPSQTVGTAADSLVSPLVHTTLQATPTVLEVGVPGGAHGWLKIRAELGEGGAVQASMSATTHAGQETLRRELPAINAFLHSEQVPVSVQVMHGSDGRVPEAREGGSAMGQGLTQDANASGSGRNDGRQEALAGGDGAGQSGERQQQNDGYVTGTGSRLTQKVEVNGDAEWQTPSGYGTRGVAHGGSWLNVIA